MRPITGTEAAERLKGRKELAMFPLSNLARYGEAGHPRAMRFWADGGAVFGLSEEGVAMPVFPEGFDASPVQEVLERVPDGIIGPVASVAATLKALGLEASLLRHPEPQYLMALADLIPAPGKGTLVPVADHRALVAGWRAAFNAELGLPGHDTEAQVDRWIAEDTHRVWCVDGVPSALTGINAGLPEIVQVGGVYVPPEGRGRGLARRAVAAHLAELREAGVTRATLCAASVAASKAYTALGFQRIGDYSITFLPETVRGAA